jgi:hypothetical protein
VSDQESVAAFGSRSTMLGWATTLVSPESHPQLDTECIPRSIIQQPWDLTRSPMIESILIRLENRCNIQGYEPSGVVDSCRRFLSNPSFENAVTWPLKTW